MEFIYKKFDQLTTSELYEIMKARNEVFIVEQKILYQDLDDIDYESTHFYLTENNKVIAYLRAFYLDKDEPIIQLGRVLTITHLKGIGKTLMNKSLKVIKETMKPKKIILNSQCYCVNFYQKFGFKIVSDEFIEAGIKHVKMELDL